MTERVCVRLSWWACRISPSFFTWVLWIKVRLSGLHSMIVFRLSHLVSLEMNIEWQNRKFYREGIIKCRYHFIKHFNGHYLKIICLHLWYLFQLPLSKSDQGDLNNGLDGSPWFEIFTVIIVYLEGKIKQPGDFKKSHYFIFK